MNKQNYITQIIATHNILFYKSEMLLKYIIMYLFHGSGLSWVSILWQSVRRLNTLYGIEDHTFGPTNVREHFPEKELALSKNRLLEVDRLVEQKWIELIWIK